VKFKDSVGYKYCKHCDRETEFRPSDNVDDIYCISCWKLSKGAPYTYQSDWISKFIRFLTGSKS
jgi:hypothetical protein